MKRFHPIRWLLHGVIAATLEREIGFVIKSAPGSPLYTRGECSILYLGSDTRKTPAAYFVEVAAAVMFADANLLDLVSLLPGTTARCDIEINFLGSKTTANKPKWFQLVRNSLR